MSLSTIPYILEAHQLKEIQNRKSPGDILVVEVGKQEDYVKQHIPNARFIGISEIKCPDAPRQGHLPPLAQLSQSLGAAGITSDTHVVAYDNNLNSAAARLLWVLEAVNHRKMSLLNGGLSAWMAAGYEFESGDPVQSDASLPVTLNPDVIASKQDVLSAINMPDITIVDSRSPEEHRGEKSASDRKGRIPGSVNLNWLDTIDQDRRFRPEHELLDLLNARGIEKQQELIVHCQTHQRSSHAFVMLRSLGFSQVKGYAGSWSEWSADPECPAETG